MQGAMSAAGEAFSMGMQKSPLQPSPNPGIRLAYTHDGTAVFKHTPALTHTPQATDYQPPASSAPSQPAAAAGGNGAAPQPPSAHGLVMNTGEPVKRKRGRPRKYGPDGSMALALVPVPPPAAAAAAPPGFSPGSAGGGVMSPAALQVPRQPASSDAAVKKARGRPPGSVNKKQMQKSALGSAGIGFTPHVITVKAGEDVSAKIMSFSQNGSRAVCILSANGSISNVTLRQAATSGGTVTYEGRFEILSLSGSFLLSESSGQRSRTGGLSISLAGPDGRVLGGGVAGLLTAASPVQVVVGSFVPDGKKEPKQVNFSDPASASVKLVPSWLPGATSPPSRGTLSESSGGPGSPPNHNTGTTFTNNSQQGLANFHWK